MPRSRRSHKPRDIQRATLPNGIRVVSEQMPHVRSVTLGMLDQFGFARRIRTAIRTLALRRAHGVQRHQESLRRTDRAIGRFHWRRVSDAFTGEEIGQLQRQEVLDEHLPNAFDVVADLVRNPLFQKEDIEKEKGVILEELKMEVDNPEYLLHEIFSSNFWKGHALGRPILGTKQTIRSFDREKVESFYRQFYVPSNILITAAGSLNHQQIVEMVGEKVRRFRSHADRSSTAQACAAACSARFSHDKNSLEQVHIVHVGVPSIPISHESRYASFILNTILSGGMSSRLFQNIRRRRVSAIRSVPN